MNSYSSILGRLHLRSTSKVWTEWTPKPSIFVHGPRVLQLPVSNVGGPVYGVSFSGKPRNQGRRGVAMVQWNAEKLNFPGEGEIILRLEPQLFWLWFWVRPKLPAVARTTCFVLSSGRAAVDPDEGFILYGLWFRSTDYRMYNTKYNYINYMSTSYFCLTLYLYFLPQANHQSSMETFSVSVIGLDSRLCKFSSASFSAFSRRSAPSHALWSALHGVQTVRSTCTTYMY